MGCAFSCCWRTGLQDAPPPPAPAHADAHAGLGVGRGKSHRATGRQPPGWPVDVPAPLRARRVGQRTPPPELQALRAVGDGQPLSLCLPHAAPTAPVPLSTNARSRRQVGGVRFGRPPRPRGTAAATAAQSVATARPTARSPRRPAQRRNLCQPSHRSAPPTELPMSCKKPPSPCLAPRDASSSYPPWGWLFRAVSSCLVQ